MRRSKRSTTKGRGNSPRPRRCATPPTAPSRTWATDEEHACRIAKLRAKKRQLTQRLDRINNLLDAAYIDARRDKVPHATVAHAIRVAEGREQAGDDLEQLEAELRRATHDAMRRRDRGPIETQLDASGTQRETARMPKPSSTPSLYRRRTSSSTSTTDEWFDADGIASPPAAGGDAAPTKHDLADRPPSRTVGDADRPDEDDEGEDQDEDEGDEGEDEGEDEDEDEDDRTR